MKFLHKTFWLIIATTITLPIYSKSISASSVAGQAKACLESIKKDPAFKGAGIGILAISLKGDTLLSCNPDRLFIPASNIKLITTALALQKHGAGYRFETKIGYSGDIKNGRLAGDLYIIGGGDPTICSSSPIALPRNVLLGQWKDIIAGAGIREINGYVIGDGRCFPGMAEHGSWQLSDSGVYYGCGISGLSFNENIQTFKILPGKHPGDRPEISLDFPEAPWMQYNYDNCTTGKKKSANTLYLYTSSQSPTGEMRGSFPAGVKNPYIEKNANKFPEYTCAYYLAKTLAKAGISCNKGPADLGHIFPPKEEDWKETPQNKLKIIGSTFSPALNEIAWITLSESNNLYAEAMIKSLGAVYDGSTDAVQLIARNGLKKFGLNTGELKMKDGCGLSRENLASPQFICSFLKAIMRARYFDEFVDALPRVGKDGTLKYMMPKVPEETKGRIRMKSGSMGGVRCFSGYIIPTSGRKRDTIVFSIMINSFVSSSSEIQARLEELITLIASCN